MHDSYLVGPASGAGLHTFGDFVVSPFTLIQLQSYRQSVGAQMCARGDLTTFQRAGADELDVERWIRRTL